jgi:hypothetical protein
MNQDVKFKVIDLLKSRGTYHVSVNGKQHYTRCPFCGDSRNLSHAHMSVHIDTFSETPMMYRCLKCDTKGLLTDSVLIELDLPIDAMIQKELKSFNRKAIRLGKLVNLEFERFSVPLYQDTYTNQMKLDYLNGRLGTDINLTEARDKKIILNLFDFMSLNQLSFIDGINYNTMKMLNDNYIGFLSTNNNCITFRDITGNQKCRYFKVILNQKNVNPDTFYGIPGRGLSLLYTHDVNIHMAEGIFDILSIQKNLPHNSDYNYFYATCGFGGVTLLQYLLHHGINTGVNLHIYSDKDKSDWNHKKYLFNNSGISNWLDHIYIHRNQFGGEKDYGVPVSNIIDSYRKIK